MELISSISDIIFGLITMFNRTSEKKIKRNLEFFQEQTWFQALYKLEQYKNLIDQNISIREFIGGANIKRLSQNKEKMKKFQDKLQKYLEAELKI